MPCFHTSVFFSREAFDQSPFHIPFLINTSRPRQNGRHFPDDIFKCIFLNENVCISIEISLMFVPKGPINNIPALVQIMAWRRPGDKPLSEPTLVCLLTHICVTRPQWVKYKTVLLLLPLRYVRMRFFSMCTLSSLCFEEIKLYSFVL